jgi:hypothetical protein
VLIIIIGKLKSVKQEADFSVISGQNTKEPKLL